jgi:hypothetical protein
VLPAADAADDADAIPRASDFIGRTYHPQVDILAAGPSLLAVSTQLATSWTALRDTYHLILIATGPLVCDAKGSGSSPSDQLAGSLLPLADAAILSVELGSTPVSVAIQTVELLKAAGVNLLGCVVQGATAAE